jgi:hypothetical protein
LFCYFGIILFHKRSNSIGKYACHTLLNLRITPKSRQTMYYEIRFTKYRYGINTALSR